MKVIAHLFLFALTGIAALLGAGVAVSMTFGGEAVGFAGAGLFLFIVPGAVVGLVGGYVAFFRQEDSGGFVRRGAVSMLAAGATAMLLTGAGAWAFHWLGRSPRPDFVYVAMPAKTEVSIPSEAVMGQWVPFKAVSTIEYKRIPYDELPPRTGFSSGPDRQTFVPQNLVLLADPGMLPHFRYDEHTGSGTVWFGQPGTYRVWAGRPTSTAVEGNVAVVTVRSAEAVYVPAEGYAVALEIELPSEVVEDDPFPIRVQRSAGPWKAVSIQDARGAPYFAELPSEQDSRVLGPVEWVVDRPGSFRMVEMNAATGIGEAVFSRTGTMLVRATMEDRVSKRPVSSNTVRVVVVEWGR